MHRFGGGQEALKFLGMRLNPGYGLIAFCKLCVGCPSSSVVLFAVLGSGMRSSSPGCGIGSGGVEGMWGKRYRVQDGYGHGIFPARI